MNIENIKDFKRYIEEEILPATKELEKLTDSSRKQLQQLAYTNLINRFDSMVDEALLNNCRSKYLIEKASENLSSSVTESALINLLMKENLQAALDSKLIDSLKISLLRERHSRKLSHLFKIFNEKEDAWNRPRVNISTGKIMKKIKPQTKKIPYSICGYADWLNCRRNSIVHGSGTTSLLDNDIKQLQNLFKCTPAKTFKIKLPTIKISSIFYLDVADILMKGVT